MEDQDRERYEALSSEFEAEGALLVRRDGAAEAVVVAVRSFDERGYARLHIQAEDEADSVQLIVDRERMIERLEALR